MLIFEENAEKAFNKALTHLLENSLNKDTLKKINVAEVIIKGYHFEPGCKERIITSSTHFDELGTMESHISVNNSVNQEPNSRIKTFKRFENQAVFPTINDYLIDKGDHIQVNSILHNDCFKMIKTLNSLKDFIIKSNSLKVDFLLIDDKKTQPVVYTEFSIYNTCLYICLPKTYFSNIAGDFGSKPYDETIDKIMIIINNNLENVIDHSAWLNQKI